MPTTTRSRASGAQTSNSTSHPITLPTIVAGDVVLCFFSSDTGTSLNVPSGWDSIGSLVQSGNALRGTVLWRRATGSDGLTITTGGSVQSTHVTISVQNGANPQALGDDGTSSTQFAAPLLTPSTGTADYLCITSAHTDSSSTTSQSITGVPSGFTNLQSRNPTTNNSAATFTMEQNLTNVPYLWPPVGTMAFPEEWVAFTVAIGFEQHDAPTGGLTEPYIRSAASTYATIWYSDPPVPPLTVGAPPGIAVGDLLLAWICADGDHTPFSALTWDRSDATVLAHVSSGQGIRDVQVKLFRRIVTANDAAQPSFVFQRGIGGEVAVHITCFKAGTFNPADPVSGYSLYDYTGVATNQHTLPSVPTVNRGILMAFFGADTGGTRGNYPSTPGNLNHIGGEATNWISNTVYWQYPPQTGNTSSYTVTFSKTSQYNSAAIIVKPFGAPVRLGAGVGTARCTAKGVKTVGRAFLKTGGAAAGPIAKGASSLGKLLKAVTVRGVATAQAAGAHSGGVSAAVVATGTYLTAASATSADVPVPAGVVAGQIAVVVLWTAAPASLAITAPGGFAELPSPPETTGVVSSTRLFWRQASGADSGVYTFSWTGAVLREAVAFTLGRTTSLGGPPTPFEAFADNSSAGVSVGLTPAVSGTAGDLDRCAVWVGGASAETTWTPPPGYRPTVTGARLAVGTRAVPAGSTGPVVGTAASGWGIGWGDAWGQ